jgi:hypothetical protein
MELGHVDYSKPPPAKYHCHTCKKHGCKLWREYQAFADQAELVCCDCAGTSQGRDVSDIDADGRTFAMKIFEVERFPLKTDTIGWRVPAVPTEDGSTFWGYTSVPDVGCAWWRGLPTRV